MRFIFGEKRSSGVPKIGMPDTGVSRGKGGSDCGAASGVKNDIFHFSDVSPQFLITMLAFLPSLSHHRVAFVEYGAKRVNTTHELLLES
jgi:hypothetical protein